MPILAVVDKSELTAVSAIYGDVPAIQVVWTDSAGPWVQLSEERGNFPRGLPT